VDDIGLEPLDGGARCTSLAASLGDGDMDSLAYDPRALMPAGRLTVVALPGRNRDLRSVDMHCRGAGRPTVTVRVFAAKG